MIANAGQARLIEPGKVLASERHAPITRLEIAWYRVASYDLNPIHVDEPYARAAGFPSVVGQGMFPLGFLGRQLTSLVGLERIRSLGGDFVGPVLPGDELVSTLRVLECLEREGGVELVWGLNATRGEGQTCLRGKATTWHASEGPLA